MNILFLKRLRILSLNLLLVWALQSTAQADPVVVRSVQGTIHGFLELRTADGQVVASGDNFQVVRGTRVTSRTVFHFKDGSIDDETTVYLQRHTFELVSDHHIQKGPSFPHPMDVLIDVQTGQVTVHSIGKDGKEEVKTDHLDLRPAQERIAVAAGSATVSSPKSPQSLRRRLRFDARFTAVR